MAPGLVRAAAHSTSPALAQPNSTMVAPLGRAAKSASDVHSAFFVLGPAVGLAVGAGVVGPPALGVEDPHPEMKTPTPMRTAMISASSTRRCGTARELWDEAVVINGALRGARDGHVGKHNLQVGY